MNRFPDALMPELDELNQLFSEATGDPENLDERDRTMLLVWEQKVREQALRKAQSPTGEPMRWRLPDERQSLTHGFRLHDKDGQPLKVYLTIGMYSDGQVGELFCSVDKEGTFLSGIMDALSHVLSVALQHGVPLEALLTKFKHSKFPPAGIVTGAPGELRGFFGSALDYIGQYLELRFPDGKLRQG